LSGEVAITSDLAQNLRVATDWGLEVSLLSEVFRNASGKRISQVDLGVYSHKHQPVGAGREEGLQRMVSDVATTILRGLVETEGAEISEATIHAVTVVYTRLAQDSVRKYFVDSRANGLDYDRHAEELLVEKFSKIIGGAGERYLRDPYREQLPDFLRVYSAVPDFSERMSALAKPASGAAR
jgi:glucosyl-3-phosphoglycerate synthase